MTIPLEIARTEMLRRIAVVLQEHLAAELEEMELNDVPGLNLTPPEHGAFFTLRSEGKIATHRPGFDVAIYVYPFEEIDPVTAQMTGGPQRRIIRYDREVAVAVRLAVQAGDFPFEDEHKDLDSEERDGVRLAHYLAAVSQVIYSQARDGRAITLVKESRLDEDLDLSTDSDQAEMFGRVVFDITQRVSVKQHNG